MKKKPSVFRAHNYDFIEEYRERNWNIYNMYTLERRTLTHIAKVHGLSRERCRQIIFKAGNIMKFRRHLKESDRKKAAWCMKHLPLSTRAHNVLANAGWDKLGILLFVGLIKPKEFLNVPNAGKKTFQEVYKAIKEVDEDAANIWTSGHGENYNPVKHGGPRHPEWYSDEQYSILGIHKESGD